MSKIGFALLFILANFTCIGQTNLDSLYKIWQDETQSDSIRTEILYGLADYYPGSKSDTAIALAQDLIDYAEEHQYERAKALAYKIIGDVSRESNYVKALEYMQRSLEHFENIGDKRMSAALLHNIATVYDINKDLPKALEIYQRCLSVFQEIGEKKFTAIVTWNIGINYRKQGDLQRALDYYQKSLIGFEKLGLFMHVETVKSDIAGIYKLQGDLPHALAIYQNSLKYFEENQFVFNGALCQIDIAGIYIEQGRYAEALPNCKLALTIMQEYGNLRFQKDACQCLYDAYKALGNGNEALAYLEKVNAITDSLNQEETTKKIEQMEFQKVMLADSLAKADEARLVQEAHKEEIRQKNQTRNIALGGGIILLILVGGLFGRVSYIRKSKAALQTEKDRSENLLLNILPADVAAELKEKGKADARDFDLVSILFTDFKGFTEQSAKMSAADLVNEINVCFEAFDGIMAKHGVEKIKTIGDAYMAAGGLPVPTDDSVKNTILAALEMQEFIASRGKEQRAIGLPFFEMRVGIHTGPAVAGIVGVKKFQYDIWGDTVNTASRMESSSEVGKVNISQATYQLLKEDSEFSFESRGKIAAKGKGEIEMYFVRRT